MAYKIQVGAMLASGSLTQTGTLTVSGTNSDITGSVAYSESTFSAASSDCGGSIVQSGDDNSYALIGSKVRFAQRGNKSGQLEIMNASDNISLKMGAGSGDAQEGTAGKGFVYLYNASNQMHSKYDANDEILSGSGTITSNGAVRFAALDVKGNLTVESTVTLNTSTVAVKDAHIILNADATGGWPAAAGTVLIFGDDDQNGVGGRLAILNDSDYGGKHFSVLDGDGSGQIDLKASHFVGAATGIPSPSTPQGVLHSVTAKDNGDTLAKGLNYVTATPSGEESLVLSNSGMSAGDIVKVKFYNSNINTTNKWLITGTAASQTIDGANTLSVQSPWAAVQLVYRGSNEWSIL